MQTPGSQTSACRVAGLPGSQPAGSSAMPGSVRWKLPVVALPALLAAIAAISGCDSEDTAAYEITGGNWLSGEGFVAGTRWVKEGRFSAIAPDRVDSVIDLNGAFVISPLAEAHQHDIEFPDQFDSVSAAYLRAGVFYVAIQSDVPELATQLRERARAARTVDAIWAHGALTGARGHPQYLYEQRLRDEYEAVLGELPEEWFSGRAYHVVPDEAALPGAWNQLKASGPDFVKVVLSYSEDHAQNIRDPSPYVRRGLDPALLPTVVDMAHAAGLRVSAHIETATDFHHAVVAGVDLIAHLPGYYIHSADQRHRARIAKDDAGLAARRKVSVVTTTVLATSVARDSSMIPIVKEEQRRNLRLLHDAGVRLLIGSDHHTALEEAMYLRRLGVFDDATILRLWIETAPALFPDRHVGTLEHGAEASFLALRTNPLYDLGAVQQILVSMKEGQILRGSVE